MDGGHMLYDELCRVLTDYEGNGEPSREGGPWFLYDLLVRIQNMFDEGDIVVTEGE